MSLADGAPELSGLAGWVVGVMDSLGGMGAGLLIAAENIFPPLPSEVILPMAGFAASRGSMGLVEAIAWCTLGSLVGAWVLYGLGALLGMDRARALAVKVPLVKESDVDYTQRWFEKYGALSVFSARMVPGLRSVISLPAGAQRMPLVRFTLLTTAGSLIWNVILIMAGYQLGNQWHRVEGYVDNFQKLVVVLILAVVAWFVAHRLVEQHQEKSLKKLQAEKLQARNLQAQSTQNEMTGEESKDTPIQP